MLITRKMLFEDLPAEAFKQITAYTIPEEASDVWSDTYKASRSTLDLQLVNKLWHEEVTAELYRRRPLNINVLDVALLRHLRSGNDPDLKDPQDHFWKARNDLADNAPTRIQRIPLHRFRWIHVHFTPVLGPVNVAQRQELTFFRAQPTPQSPVLAQYWELLSLEEHLLDENAKAIAIAFQKQSRLHRSSAQATCDFEIFFRDGPEDCKLPDSLAIQHRAIRHGPVQQLNYIPRDQGKSDNQMALFPTCPDLPRWSPKAMLWIACHFKSFYPENLAFTAYGPFTNLPKTLVCLQHDRTKSAAWHHNYWRYRLSHMFTSFEDAEVDMPEYGDSVRAWLKGKSVFDRQD